MSELVGKRPVQVSWATGLLVGSVVAGIFRTILTWDHYLEMTESETPWAIYELSALVIINGFLFWKIHQGKNWARVLYLVTFLGGLVIYPLALQFIDYVPSRSDIATIVIQSAAQGYALFLIFTPPGNLWFKERTVAKASG